MIKNNLANYAFENYEIAAYETLLVMAESAGHTTIQPFERSLSEEERMAERVRQMLPEVTRRYIAMTAASHR